LRGANHQAIFGLVYAPLTQTHYYGFDNKTYKQHNNIQTPLNACSATLPLRVPQHFAKYKHLLLCPIRSKVQI
jgi:fructose-1,6-bisphosphatase/inositol monophosphatase family enzyme